MLQLRGFGIAVTVLLFATSLHTVSAVNDVCGNIGESRSDFGDLSMTGFFSALPNASQLITSTSLSSFFLPPSVCLPHTFYGSLAPSYLQWGTSIGSNSWNGNCTVADTTAFAAVFAPGASVQVRLGYGNSSACSCSATVPSGEIVAGVTLTVSAAYSSKLTSYTFYPASCRIAFLSRATTLGLRTGESFAITYVATTSDTDSTEQQVLAALAIAVIVVVIVTVFAVIGTIIYMCCCKRSNANAPQQP